VTEAEIFLLASASRPALGPMRSAIQWVPVPLSPVVKRSCRETDRSFPSSAEVKHAWSYTSTPPYVFVACRLIKHMICPHGMVLS
jgi:hypothetical protein